MDPRLRTAVDASIGWYEDLFALHHVGSALADGVFSALGDPPPLHSHAVTVEPTATLATVLRRLEPWEHCGFKDSFATLDGAAAAGLDLLFEATWMHREPADPPSAPTAWSPVTGPADLATWNAGWDTEAVLVPALLARAHLVVLARWEGDAITAGAVARLGSGAVDVSNVHAVGVNQAVEWAELSVAVAGLFPGRPLVGYERGDDLEGALAGGFGAVGDLRVWVR